MLAPIKHLLAQKRIVLASSSPRRQELITTIGINCELCPPRFEENLKPEDFKEFSEFVEATAQGKAEEVYQRLSANNESSNLLVIAADTMVALGTEFYGKPKNADDAIRMLTNLSGRCNRVFTGVVLMHKNGLHKFTETTDVYFSKLSQEQIKAYVETGDPLDKAGSYGIAGMAGSMISKIDGDYYCVMGLPLNRLCLELHKMLTEDQK